MRAEPQGVQVCRWTEIIQMMPVFRQRLEKQPCPHIDNQGLWIANDLDFFKEEAALGLRGAELGTPEFSRPLLGLLHLSLPGPSLYFLLGFFLNYSLPVRG